MADVTGNYNLPYQEVGDSPAGYQGLQDLAEAMDALLSGNLTLGGDLTVPGDQDVAGDLNVAGAIIASNQLYTVTYSGTSVDGFFSIAHGAGFTPVGGWAVTTNPANSFAQCYGIDSFTATTVRMRFANVAGDGVWSGAVAGRIFLMRP